eukprot:5677565-Prorocentrum_lima.AAC.1
MLWSPRRRMYPCWPPPRGCLSKEARRRVQQLSGRCRLPLETALLAKPLGSPILEARCLHARVLKRWRWGSFAAGR